MGYHTREFETARGLLTEAEEIFGRLEDDDGLGDVAWGRGNLLLAQVELDQAHACYVAAADRYRQSGNEFGVGWSLFEAGYVLTQLGQPDRAWPVINEALRLFWGHHDISGVVMNLFQLAGIARALGDLPRSYRLLGAMDALRKSSGVDIVGLDINSIEGIDPDHFDQLEGDDAAAFAEGGAMTMAQAVAYGLAGPTDS
jgi:tetratricopeptide (TPR) repeat protein